MQDFMKGRYGMDDLSCALGVAGIFLTAVTSIFAWRVTSLAALVLVLVALMRSMSRDLTGRRAENEAFRALLARIPGIRGNTARSADRGTGSAGSSRTSGDRRRGNFDRAKRTAGKMWVNRKTTKYFRCKTCGAMMSVPRGKGRIRVTCPRCRTTVEKKS
ncbi:hypothetical protein Corgl_0651 [Coriobacterium glomerans PW2]|uniref:FORGETTER1 second zinc ribbon domain-containing protein n=1 Tax=Coriobacterium glomerans (strain ATCC 49209 / DSM 20642 / JCM 10262 / PW2) TaxID=700015 RepID=F2N7E9_CORGP|nr:hypothetical protein [Coriobacterium glomerans]AEB06765.1 hypothetical protein Corgl_0651 [Coriobacterium glomerans PW2]